MKKKTKIALTILQFALVIGFAFAFLWHTNNSLDPVTVYRIAQDIPLNSKIGLSDFKRTTIPSDAYSDDMITDPTEYVDLHASTNLFANQFAIDAMFVESDNVDPFEINDLTNLRKVSIPATYVDALGGNVAYGDRVDLVYVGNGETKEGTEYTYSKTFLQGALVHAVTTEDGYRFIDHSDRAEGQPTVRSENASDEVDTIEPGNLAQITLAVTPAQAEEIATRLNTGTIQIIGRFNESKDSESAGYVIGEYEATYSGQGLAESNK